MSVKKIVPCLDIKNGRVVKGVKFQGLSDVQDPVVLAETYNNNGADEIVFYDITASVENRKIFTELLVKTAEKITVPLTVGGGINSLDDIETVLNNGADKVSINSGAIKNPELISEAAKKYGSNCIVFALDVKKSGENKWQVYSNGGTVNTNIDAIEWIKLGEKMGAGEVVINSIDNDGVKKGFDIELLKAASQAVKIPIVASGGAGKKEDFLEALKIDGVASGLAASVFHFGEIKIPELKSYLHENNIEVNL